MSLSSSTQQKEEIQNYCNRNHAVCFTFNYYWRVEQAIYKLFNIREVDKVQSVRILFKILVWWMLLYLY